MILTLKSHYIMYNMYMLYIVSRFASFSICSRGSYNSAITRGGKLDDFYP